MKTKSGKKTTVSSSRATAVSEPETLNPSHEDIARLAYSYWEERAGRGGSPEEDWCRAEHDIRLRIKTGPAADKREV